MCGVFNTPYRGTEVIEAINKTFWRRYGFAPRYFGVRTIWRRNFSTPECCTKKSMFSRLRNMFYYKLYLVIFLHNMNVYFTFYIRILATELTFPQTHNINCSRTFCPNIFPRRTFRRRTVRRTDTSPLSLQQQNYIFPFFIVFMLRFSSSPALENCTLSMRVSIYKCEA